MKVFFSTFLCVFTLFLFAQNEGKKGAVSFKTFDESIDPMSVHVEVLDNETKEQVTTLESSGGGDAKINLQSGKSYLIYFSHPGYLFQSVVLNLSDSTSDEKKLKDVVLEKVSIGKKAVLNAIAFDVYQKLLLEESMPDLDRIIKLLNDSPNLEVELGGYTDNIGSISLNKKLSEQRVKTLADMLVSKGINEMRLKYKGYGPNLPIATNFTEEGRQMNNRVELKILSVSFVPPTAAELKKKKNTTKKAEGDEDQPVDEDNNGNGEKDTLKIDKTIIDPNTITAKDTLLKIDYKGMLVADKKPLANSTVNLLTDQGKIFKTTVTDANGGFQFVGVPSEQDLTLGLDAAETKKYKKVVLTDTAGVIVKEMDKVNGEFVLTILPSEKKKLGKVYVADPELKLKRIKPKTQNQNSFVTGKVVDDNGNPIKADIEVVNTAGSVVDKLSSKAGTGDFSITLPAGLSYDISVSKFGYTFQTVNIMLPEADGYQKKLEDIILQKVEAGKKIVLNNIFFDVNQSTLKKESYVELGRALKLMNDISSLSIEISGHTDNVGSSKSNKELSEQRAKAVMDYLVDNGANKERLQYKGYGASKPIANNKTETGRQLNRRTEFKVLKVDAGEIKTKEANIEANSQQQTETNVSEGTETGAKGIPERFKQYDLDHNGSISYEEVIGAIDLYFEEHPNGNAKMKEELTGLFDYYFEK
jgi:outer membrane protein OmpA-like peptidoglycan-associated protein